MKLRLGLVGLGDAWEARHLPALRALNDRFEVRAICTDVSLRAERAAAEFDAATVDGFRALARREDVDAILILSPEWYGPLPIFAACDAGKAVYCAAALDFQVDQAIEVRDRVQEAGIAFMAEFPRRHSAATLRLKELIATRLGKPQLLFCHLRKESLPSNGHRRAQSTAVANRDLLEMIDWCHYIVDSYPTSVVGVRHRNQVDQGNQYRMLSLDFSENGEVGEGPMAQINCGHYLPVEWTEAISFRPPAAMQVRCENGVAFLDLPSSLIWFDEAGRHMESLEMDRPVGEQLMSLFYRSITSLVQRTSDLEDAYRAISTVAKAEQSFGSGRRIQLDG